MEDFDTLAIIKALGDENRLQILRLLTDGEKCACILLEKLNIGQSTLSHHMKILSQSKVVSFRKDGKWTYYTLNKAALDCLIDLFNSLKK